MALPPPGDFYSDRKRRDTQPTDRPVPVQLGNFPFGMCKGEEGEEDVGLPLSLSRRDISTGQTQTNKTLNKVTKLSVGRSVGLVWFGIIWPWPEIIILQYSVERTFFFFFFFLFEEKKRKGNNKTPSSQCPSEPVRAARRGVVPLVVIQVMVGGSTICMANQSNKSIHPTIGRSAQWLLDYDSSIAMIVVVVHRKRKERKEIPGGGRCAYRHTKSKSKRDLSRSLGISAQT